MWKFSRHSDEVEAETAKPSGKLVVEQGLLPSGERSREGRHKIAHVQLVGSTAVATLTVTELTQQNGVEMLADLLDELGETHARHYVLDIQNVQIMDSACLGCLVQALNTLSSNGGKIALANTVNSVQYLFKMTQLDRVFPICTDVMSAIAALERIPSQSQARKGQTG
ncbi:MAG: STAS domain-containing protein [Phycisphaerales bacterium]|nr:STAS domain-containing protein [Phycisphaerales bacterium]MCI0674349.1 STAS domain-containing protein [Phycisphaerales bacterium]